MYRIYELKDGFPQYKRTISGLFRWELKEIARQRNNINNLFYDRMLVDEVLYSGRVHELFVY
uniref:Uncharacterized protein n=1 Tax=uncultured marine virus TaxID=186617 RepID=A0A0F7L4P6_9VIRU|nr:hypothetical protein [uncultured marine virus]